MKPIVSVIIATYRREDTLKKALHSLFDQTMNEFEVVIVDDNADLEWNKKVENIVCEFRRRCPSIPICKITNRINQGAAETRNIGIRIAQGKYITFLDDDDVYRPEKLVLQVTFMEERGLDYCITDLELFNQDGVMVDCRKRTYIREISAQALMVYHLKYHMTGTDVIMFRKDYLLKIGSFPKIDVGDEFYLMEKAIEGGGKFGYLPGCEVTAVVHMGEASLSSGLGKIKGENELYQHKKTFFRRLRKKDIRYIKARHYAVVAYTWLRMKRLIPCIANILIGLFVAPIAFCGILIKR